MTPGTEIAIPDRVVEAAAKAMYGHGRPGREEGDSFMAPVPWHLLPDPGKEWWSNCARAALTACLAEWGFTEERREPPAGVSTRIMEQTRIVSEWGPVDA